LGTGRVSGVFGGVVNEFFAEINGHWVVDMSRVTARGRVSAGPVCIRCGAHFAGWPDIEHTWCPVSGAARGHELVIDPYDGLLYCERCPLVAYDLDDVATEPQCPMPLHAFGQRSWKP